MATIDVETTSGTIRGELSDGTAAFKGIPYAEPPFGPNLFKPPVPRTRWDGVRDCTAYGPRCPQPSLGIFADLEDGEDCLSVNVWAPEGASGRPVLFWIHGGGFTLGSNAEPGSDGSAFARDGAVLVSCNYRLGAFGFLHAGHLDDAYTAASGAYGLADQIAALRWTRENIANFGGNPDNITIFGSSAGATFVNELLGCPSAQGLFHRAVSQSAPGAPVFGFPAGNAEPVAELVLAKLGVTAADLPSVPSARFLEAQTELIDEIRRGEHPECGRTSLPFVPFTGGDLMPRPAAEAIADGVGADVALVIGTNRDECTLYQLMAEMPGPVDVAPPKWGADPALQQRIRDVYDRSLEPGSAIGAQIAMDTDRVFRIPSLRIAEAHHRAGGSTRVYQFAWRSTACDGRVGASHGLEVPFVFDDFSLPITKSMLGDDVPGSLTEELHGSWISFATNGDPAATGAVPAWPEYEPGSRQTMVFDEKTAVVADPDGERRASWHNVSLRH
ncbi:carboxylesterase/lipase family protein [Amycolatopsis pithecellobii]|uniref:Carboxylic ester hydrolase n=1 Tax=Amycolatopsis pithecellobii TaxID=664692 RepID=A0A6N7Z2U0_9PSEU|nr:carboxylesterase family protein [Amycolatopsis pithecellobii]MTD54214.1 carboxylesterase family protein [Amycolatopsis pithecellobii]